MINQFGQQSNLSNSLISPIIFITGPTAIGKSSLAVKLAIKLKGEIINADSMQVYSNLNVLTARPSKKDSLKIPHHLYGHINGSIRYNVASWCNDVKKIIKKNNEKKIQTILVGGTGMYIEKLIKGLIQIPKISEAVKKDSEKLLLKIGISNFSEKVKQIDKEAFLKVSKNDVNRLRRIWEVFQETNETFSFWSKKENTNYLHNQKYLIYLFTPDRKKIYNRVNYRFNEMIKKGAIEEVKKLQSLDLDKSLPIMRAHGVPEILNYLSKSVSLEECIDKGQQVTRNYVKRQLTWWRATKLNIYKHINQFPSEIDPNSLNF